MREEAATLLPWGSGLHRLDVGDRDSDEDSLESAVYEDAREGPLAARVEFEVRHSGHFDPSVNRAVVAARKRTARPSGEHITTVSEVLEELHQVKIALRGLVQRLEEVENRRAGAQETSVGARNDFDTASIGCSCESAAVLGALAFATWRYARVSSTA